MAEKISAVLGNTNVPPVPFFVKSNLRKPLLRQDSSDFTLKKQHFEQQNHKFPALKSHFSGPTFGGSARGLVNDPSAMPPPGPARPTYSHQGIQVDESWTTELVMPMIRPHPPAYPVWRMDFGPEKVFKITRADKLSRSQKHAQMVSGFLRGANSVKPDHIMELMYLSKDSAPKATWKKPGDPAMVPVHPTMARELLSKWAIQKVEGCVIKLRKKHQLCSGVVYVGPNEETCNALQVLCRVAVVATSEAWEPISAQDVQEGSAYDGNNLRWHGGLQTCRSGASTVVAGCRRSKLRDLMSQQTDLEGA
ncbi:hypothetical protein DFH07DRAFT_785959 [Mycena maculata]|uniref:Uncharacterized protein n=1 Tax=Mycena maculata TaxID=230809 RepID=A0AAD7MEJ8_9AGAR|nr:hypothetical protein DFH07DRAFT_785959 [Mycena maculata]